MEDVYKLRGDKVVWWSGDGMGDVYELGGGRRGKDPCCCAAQLDAMLWTMQESVLQELIELTRPLEAFLRKKMDETKTIRERLEALEVETEKEVEEVGVAEEGEAPVIGEEEVERKTTTDLQKLAPELKKGRKQVAAVAEKVEERPKAAGVVVVEDEEEEVLEEEEEGVEEVVEEEEVEIVEAPIFKKPVVAEVVPPPQPPPPPPLVEIRNNVNLITTKLAESRTQASYMTVLMDMLSAMKEDNDVPPIEKVHKVRRFFHHFSSPVFWGTTVQEPVRPVLDLKTVP